jgi:wyosine [tRNA(Phe)-imidazoG37] synthetase (radical SAM superfamily)
MSALKGLSSRSTERKDVDDHVRTGPIQTSRTESRYQQHPAQDMHLFLRLLSVGTHRGNAGGPPVFYEPDDILRAVRDKVENAFEAGEAVDYLTFVPDGESTLDINLGVEIDSLKSPGPRTAVISNGSLVSLPDVREELGKADWVSLKVDAVREDIWHKIDRPHGALRLPAILDGMLAFTRSYRGVLATETMLVRDVNDSPGHLNEIADFLAQLAPATAYLAIPTRPPAEEWVYAPDEAVLNRAYQILSEKVERVEYLIGYEGNTFAFTGDVEEDFLSITSVHPMREDAVRAFLARAGAGWAVVRRLVAEDQLVETEYEGHRFFLRRLRKQ